MVASRPNTGVVEPYTITQEDSNVTQADTSAGAWGDLFSFRVPKGELFILRPEDIFRFYGKDTGGAELVNTDRIKIEIRDSMGAGESYPVLNPVLYGNLAGEFKDKDKLTHLEVSEEIEVSELEYIVVMAYEPDLGGDKDDSYFSLNTHRRR